MTSKVDHMEFCLLILKEISLNLQKENENDRLFMRISKFVVCSQLGVDAEATLGFNA